MVDNHYILVGPKFNGSNIGGTTALFTDICFVLKDRKIDIIDTSRTNRFSSLLTVIYLILYRIRYLGKKPKIILFSSYDWKLYLPIMIFLFGYKAVCMRMFGGDFHLQLQKLPNLYKFFSLYLIKKIKLLTVETKLSVDHLKNYYSFTNVCISRNGRFINLHNKVKYRNRQRNCIFVGRITKEKGFYDIISLASSIPDFEIGIIGPIDSNLNIVNIPKNIKLMGEMSRFNVEKYLSKSLIGIFPSNHYGEGLPGFLIECQMYGVPVVAYDWLAVGETFKNGESGLLIKNKNIKHFSDAIKKIQSREIWNKMSSHGIKYSNNNFDIIKITEELIRCVDS